MNAKTLMLLVATLSMGSVAFGAARSKRANLQPVSTPISELASTESAIPSPGEDGGGDIVRVKGVGSGETEDIALKDAYRDAVESAVGMFIESDQLIKNDQLLKDEVLSQSNAYIQKYELLSKKEKGGEVTVKIMATVKKQALIKRVNVVMPSKTVAVGTTLQNIHAQNTSIEKRDGDAVALLQKELDGFDPLMMTLDCSLASSEPIIQSFDESKMSSNQRKKLKRFQKGQEGAVGAIYLFKFNVNPERYCESVAERLQPILAQVSVTEPKKISISVKRTGDLDLQNVKNMVAHCGDFRLEAGMSVGSVTIRANSAAFDPLGQQLGHVIAQEPYNFVLVTGVNSIGTVYTAYEYQLSGQAFDIVSEWCNSVAYKRRRKTSFTASFLDENGEAQLETEIVAQEGSCVGEVKARKRNSTFLCAPWLIGSMNVETQYFAKKINIPNEALPRIRQIKMEIVK